jgi:hypothetical protein
MFHVKHRAWSLPSPLPAEKTKGRGLAYDDPPFWDKDVAVCLFARAGKRLSGLWRQNGKPLDVQPVCLLRLAPGWEGRAMSKKNGRSFSWICLTREHLFVAVSAEEKQERSTLCPAQKWPPIEAPSLIFRFLRRDQ